MTTKIECIAEFKRMYGECQYTNWDSEGAYPIKYKSLVNCIDFINVIPEGIALPEPAPEPTGKMGMEWIYSEARIALSIDDFDFAVWAKVYKGEQPAVSGTFVYDGTIPKTLLQCLPEVIIND